MVFGGFHFFLFFFIYNFVHFVDLSTIFSIYWCLNVYFVQYIVFFLYTIIFDHINVNQPFVNIIAHVHLKYCYLHVCMYFYIQPGQNIKDILVCYKYFT